MKTTELRIGNLVVSGTVVGLKDNGEVSVWDGCRTWHRSEMVDDWLQPIELTEKLLDRFGFETILWKQDGVIKDVSISKDGVSLDDKYCLHGIEGMKPIQFVHQLQNLYHALTGSHLKVDEI